MSGHEVRGLGWWMVVVVTVVLFTAMSIIDPPTYYKTGIEWYGVHLDWYYVVNDMEE